MNRHTATNDTNQRCLMHSPAARTTLISNAALCTANEQVRNGQADDMGGGVYKKRLDKNRYRSLILTEGGSFWFYEYLFAKKDRDNVEDDAGVGQVGSRWRGRAVPAARAEVAIHVLRTHAAAVSGGPARRRGRVYARASRPSRRCVRASCAKDQRHGAGGGESAG